MRFSFHHPLPVLDDDQHPARTVEVGYDHHTSSYVVHVRERGPGGDDRVLFAAGSRSNPIVDPSAVCELAAEYAEVPPGIIDILTAFARADPCSDQLGFAVDWPHRAQVLWELEQRRDVYRPPGRSTAEDLFQAMMMANPDTRAFMDASSEDGEGLRRYYRDQVRMVLGYMQTYAGTGELPATAFADTIAALAYMHTHHALFAARTSAATTFWERATQVFPDPERADALMFLAMHAYLSGDHDRGAAAITAARELDPRDRDWLQGFYEAIRRHTLRGFLTELTACGRHAADWLGLPELAATHADLDFDFHDSPAAEAQPARAARRREATDFPPKRRFSPGTERVFVALESYVPPAGSREEGDDEAFDTVEKARQWAEEQIRSNVADHGSGWNFRVDVAEVETARWNDDSWNVANAHRGYAAWDFTTKAVVWKTGLPNDLGKVDDPTDDTDATASPDQGMDL